MEYSPEDAACSRRGSGLSRSFGEAKAADGRTLKLKLELRCDPNRKQVLGIATITDAEGNAKSLTIDTPAEETKERGSPRSSCRWTAYTGGWHAPPCAPSCSPYAAMPASPPSTKLGRDQARGEMRQFAGESQVLDGRPP